MSIPTQEVMVMFRGEKVKAYTLPANITFHHLHIPDGCPVCHKEPQYARALLRTGWINGRCVEKLVGQAMPCGHFFGGYSWDPLSTKIELSVAEEDYLQEWASISEEMSIHDLP
jgi:hypothetical protein